MFLLAKGEKSVRILPQNCFQRFSLVPFIPLNKIALCSQLSSSH